MGQLVLGPSLEPLKEPLGYDDAPLAGLHGRPHTAWRAEGVFSAVDGPHHARVVGVALCPEGDEAPFHRLQLVLDIAGGGGICAVRLVRGLLRLVTGGGDGAGSGAGAPVRGIRPVDDAVISRCKVVRLPRGAGTVIIWEVCYGHAVVFQHLSHLRGTLCGMGLSARAQSTTAVRLHREGVGLPMPAHICRT